MQTLLVIHNLLRWLILLFAVWAVLRSISGIAGNKVYAAADGRSSFFFSLSMDIQFLTGIGLYYAGQWFDQFKHFGDAMKDSTTRFFTIEHEVMMIIALILVHVGRAMVKKAATSPGKFKRSLIFFGIALLIILYATPWPFREIARPWFRWF